jgi:hypothetical protein
VVVGECSNCKKRLSDDETKLSKCPHCGVIWQYEVDQFGHKKEIPGAAAAIAQEEKSTNGGLTDRQWRRLIFRIIIPGVVALFTAIAGLAARSR